jgi:hypothetical protein
MMVIGCNFVKNKLSMSLLPLIIKDPMFSQGQLAFGALFFVVFVIILFYMYREDKQLHLKNYKGVKWVFLGFVSFFALLLIIKFWLAGLL